MKKFPIFSILLLLVITIGGCKKETLEEMEQSLEGSWEIREFIGGFTGHAKYPPGNRFILRFTGKNYVQMDGDSIITSVSFTVGVIGSGRKKEYTLMLGDVGTPPFFKIEGNKLTLYYGPEVQDAPTAIYERVKDPILETK